MEKLKVRKTATGPMYVFWCPACQETHTFHCRTDGQEPSWRFNGNFDKPSFFPSLRYERCHLILWNGIIEFCGDCHHKYRGQDIPLEEF